MVRLRRNRYAHHGIEQNVADAARVGGRLTCLSLLQVLGIFVLQADELHIQVSRNGSRLGVAQSSPQRVHWVERMEQEFLHATSLRAAVGHSVRCQTPRASVATLDSLVHHQLITVSELASLFEELPARFRTLLQLVDASSASGPETFVRLMLRAMGVRFETQVRIEGAGYVDFVVDGWLIIECDSKEFHEGWAKQKQDRGRDLAAARLGYVTIRPLATDILHHTDTVQQAVREVLAVMGPKFTTGVRSQLRRTPPKPPVRPRIWGAARAVPEL